MPKKDVVTEATEATEITETANLPAAEPAMEVAAEPVPVSAAAAEVTATNAETTGTAETTETATMSAAETTDATVATVSAEPAIIECVTLHGRLTHEGKTYAPHERVLLPVDLALGLIASGHVARAD